MGSLKTRRCLCSKAISPNSITLTDKSYITALVSISLLRLPSLWVALYMSVCVFHHGSVLFLCVHPHHLRTGLMGQKAKQNKSSQGKFHLYSPIHFYFVPLASWSRPSSTASFKITAHTKPNYSIWPSLIFCWSFG